MDEAGAVSVEDAAPAGGESVEEQAVEDAAPAEAESDAGEEMTDAAPAEGDGEGEETAQIVEATNADAAPAEGDGCPTPDPDVVCSKYKR